MSHTLLTKPAAVIFDLDGTLLDTEPLYTEASQKTIAPFGKTFDLSLKKKIMGGDSRVSAQILIDHFDLPLSVDDYIRQREAHLIELFANAQEIQGAGDFVEALYQCKVPQGIATSSHQHLCDMKLGKRPWRNRFARIICGDHPELKRPKPEPDIFLLCAHAMQMDPANCVVFEDSPKGIAAANAAGMTVIAINSPWVDDEDLSEAAMIVDNYVQLLALVSNW